MKHNRSWCIYLGAVSCVTGRLRVYRALAHRRSPVWGSASVHVSLSLGNVRMIHSFQLLKSNIRTRCNRAGENGFFLTFNLVIFLLLMTICEFLSGFVVQFQAPSGACVPTVSRRRENSWCYIYECSKILPQKKRKCPKLHDAFHQGTTNFDL